MPARLRRALGAGLLAFSVAAYAGVLPVWRMAERETQRPAAAFADGRMLSGDQARMEMLAVFERTLNDPLASESSKEEAAGQMQALLRTMEQENAIEEELRLRGYGQSIAGVHAGFVSVIVHRELSAEEAAAIFETVCRITGCEIGNVRLIPSQEDADMN